MKYKRYIQPGGTYFFTVVTYKRKKIFQDDEEILLFRKSVKHVRKNHPFEMSAYCICPDHIHMIWTLPENDGDFPTRWRLIKSYFSKNWKQAHQKASTSSRDNKNEQMVWHRRYWEHYIRDEDDLNKHIDYIFYNPVKHGYVDTPSKWKYSNFLDYVEKGFYSIDWGMKIDTEYFQDIGSE